MLTQGTVVGYAPKVRICFECGGRTMWHELWYALKTRPRFEQSVVAHLRNRGYAPFLPTYHPKRHCFDRAQSLELPLLRGYLFCKFDLESRFQILTTPGVNFIVGVGRAPQPIDEQEIQWIRTIVTSGLHYQPYPYRCVGQLMQVERGALVGLIGIVTEAKSASRLIVPIHPLMRSVAIDIDGSWVKPIDETTKAAAAR